MDTRGDGVRSAEAMPDAMLHMYGMACGYGVPTRAQNGKRAVGGDEDRTGLGEILDGVVQNAIALLCVLGAFALSVRALSIIVR